MESGTLPSPTLFTDGSDGVHESENSSSDQDQQSEGSSSDEAQHSEGESPSGEAQRSQASSSSEGESSHSTGEQAKSPPGPPSRIPRPASNLNAINCSSNFRSLRAGSYIPRLIWLRPLYHRTMDPRPVRKKQQFSDAEKHERRRRPPLSPSRSTTAQRCYQAMENSWKQRDRFLNDDRDRYRDEPITWRPAVNRASSGRSSWTTPLGVRFVTVKAETADSVRFRLPHEVAERDETVTRPVSRITVEGDQHRLLENALWHSNVDPYDALQEYRWLKMLDTRRSDRERQADLWEDAMSPHWQWKCEFVSRNDHRPGPPDSPPLSERAA